MTLSIFEKGAEAAIGTVTGALSWLPWAAAGLSLALGTTGTLWYRSQWESCQAASARAVAEAQAKVIAFQEADAVKTRAIEDAHAAEVARLKGDANARETAIMRAVASKDCLSSPAARAFFDGLQSNGNQAGAGAAPGAARTGAPVPVTTRPAGVR